MNTPVTCANCYWFKRCQWLLQRKPDDKPCDWEPSRYREKESA